MRLMGHIVAGFPNSQMSLEAGLGIIEGGAEFLEVQFPFSDPNADGVAIQNACNVALESGFKVSDGFNLVGKLSKMGKIIIVTYANLIFKYGIENFIKKAKSSGAWGIIVPDLLMSNDENLAFFAHAHKLELIALITPNTPQKRMKQIAKYSGEILYIVSRRGTTGKTTAIDSALLDYLKKVRNECDKALALGFGINSREQITQLRGLVDIVVVGSHFVKIIANLSPQDNIREILKTATLELLG